MSQESCAVILAAGEGKRMKRDRPKVLSPVLFKPMLQWVLDASRSAGIPSVCVVTGYLHEQVEQYLSEQDPGAATVFQSQRLGTGHAVLMAADFLRSRAAGGNVLILNGDAPFVDSPIIRRAFDVHRQSSSSVTVISAVVEDPTGYGRIVRNPETGLIDAIVEQRDAPTPVLAVREVNSGAYWFRTDDLLEVLGRLTRNNAQGEYYLTDAVHLLIGAGKKAAACTAPGANAALGANDCLQLYELNVIAREKILAEQMLAGTEIPCRDGVIIGPDVSIGSDVCLLPGTILRGKTTVGSGCTLGPNTVLTDCRVGDRAVLNSVQYSNCSIPADRNVTPCMAEDNI
jgi:bifunctional UDP-N-acetylglucosamine pyrophosphorylase / glucosamine-1-phosphate N-acetyltransferase